MVSESKGAKPAVPTLWDRKDEVLRRMEGRPMVVFLDYDGTLSPIVERPEDAVLSHETRERVRKLADRVPVAVVSGRDLPDVRRRVGIDGILYAGSHGFDIQGPNGLRMEHEEAVRLLPHLDRVEESLRQLLGEISGAQVERKKYSLAIHYRRVSESEVGRVERAVDEAMAGFPKLRKTSGKKVFDIQPKLEWDKGRALAWLLAAMENPDDAANRRNAALFPIYIGDDVTDEDAFRTLRERNDGIGIAVQDGQTPTLAHYRIPDPESVAALLDLLIDAAGGATS